MHTRTVCRHILTVHAANGTRQPSTHVSIFETSECLPDVMMRAQLRLYDTDFTAYSCHALATIVCMRYPRAATS